MDYLESGKNLDGREEAKECKACSLCKTRRNVVLGEGPIPCDVMMIGEAPGRYENEKGKPFVGKAGAILNEFLEYSGFKRSDVYITNVVKCRPPGNRRPRVREVRACKKWLDRELELVNPKKIIVMGRTAAMAEITSNAPVFTVYHPAAVIYNPRKREEIREEYREVLRV